MPRPLVQIAVGALLGWLADFNIVLNPEIFFLLIVPPLLFYDGWRIPNEDLLKESSANLQLALGLVALTVVGIGGLMHLLVPSVPLAICFAFAAAVSPTDVISVGSVTRQAVMPRRLLRILTGESLLNDSTSLVCLRLSLVVAVTGQFSWFNAAANFLWVASSGAAVGFSLALMVAHGSNWLANKLGEEASLQVTVSLLIPFAAYLLAERVHGSGVLAAAAAGIAMSYTDSSGTALTSTRVQRAPVWDTIHFAASGVAFVLLGTQLPDLLKAIHDVLPAGDRGGLWWILLCIVAINAALLMLRMVWIVIAHLISPARSYVRDEATGRMDSKAVAIMVLASPRGAITLAGVMTLPLVLNGKPLPERDLVILLAMGVIVLSLVIAGIALSFLLSDTSVDDPTHDQAENAARVWAARAALDEIKRIQRSRRADRGHDADHERATLGLIKLYESIIQSKSRAGSAAEQQQRETVDRELRLQTIQAERNAIFELLKNQKITSEVANKLILELDLLETHHDVTNKPTDAL